MREVVIVLDADKENDKVLSQFFADNNYEMIRASMLSQLTVLQEQSDCRATIVNIDSIPVRNLNFRSLKQKKPRMSFIALSKRKFHPELEESFREYISVCLATPVNVDELAYWLKTIFENEND